MGSPPVALVLPADGTMGVAARLVGTALIQAMNPSTRQKITGPAFTSDAVFTTLQRLMGEEEGAVASDPI
jgi:hypothetical protein